MIIDIFTDNHVPTETNFFISFNLILFYRRPCLTILQHLDNFRHLRHFLAEFLGTFCLVLIGDGAVAQWALSANPTSASNKVKLLIPNPFSLLQYQGRKLYPRGLWLWARPDGGDLRVWRCIWR